MAILAAGIGFSIRGGILDNWGSEFGFSGEELGKIGGGGMTGFCFGIIFGGIIVDRVGYGRLVIAAFLLHLVSAVITFAPYPGMSKDMVFNCLFWGSFIFAMANGTLEAVANPLVATLFPNNRMHYLNILHASWPAGLVLGSAMGWVLDDIFKIDWKIQLGLFLIPTLFYGVLFLGQKFPKSEASQRGLTLGEMFRDVGVIGAVLIGFFLWMFFGDNLGPTLKSLTDNDIFSGQIWGYLSIAVGVGIWLFFSGLSAFAMGSVLLFILFITHALVGAVELGTDGWIQNITGNILSSEQGKILFVFTSMTMFALRFCAHFIETRLGIKPIALLMICAALACLGLRMTSSITTFGGALVALTVYGIGKTFFWPTMLAVASDRFPRTGAVAMSIMGGLGMFSAGLLGSPGLGYAKDRFAGEALKANPAIFEQYKAEKPSSFLFLDKVPGIDAKKLGDINKKKEEKKPLTTEETQVLNASIEGDRKTLIADSFIPLTMAVIYLLLLVYFSMIGGYKPVHIDGDGTKGMRSNT
ncbi:MAG: MFS transporter [Gemmataceae bacterium]|nr:MFS transporter [Gemmataceae bacterium]